MGEYLLFQLERTRRNVGSEVFYFSIKHYHDDKDILGSDLHFSVINKSLFKKKKGEHKYEITHRRNKNKKGISNISSQTIYQFRKNL